MMVILLIISLLPGLTMPVATASEDIGSENALDALGIDTSLLPEGYDEHSLDNPYGRSNVTVNPVFELFVSGVSKSTVEKSRIVENITDGTKTTITSDVYLQNALYGHNKALNQGMINFFESPILNNQLNGEIITEQINCTVSQDPPPTVTNALFIEAAATASGNFIGENGAGKTGQVVTVGAGKLDKNGGLYLYFTDPVSGEISGEMKTLLGTDKAIGNSGLMMDEDFAEDPYMMQNYLQITTGDFDNNGIDEIAVYVPEQGRSRVEIYKLHTTSDTDDDFYLTVANWKKEWTYYFNEAPYVSNMVSLTAGDFSRDGTDDLALTWGYYYGPGENNGGQAVILYGSNTNMLQKKKTINLAYNGTEIVRAAFAYGDIDGDNVDDLILGGQLASDIAGGNLKTRFIGIFTYDGYTDNFIMSSARNFDLFEKEDGQYIHAPMAGRNDIYYSSPASIANIAAVKLDGVGSAACIYLDSILYEYGDAGLSIRAPLDHDPQFNKNKTMLGTNPHYVEYGVISADFTGDSKEALQIMQYYLPGISLIDLPPSYWWFKLFLWSIFDVDFAGELDMLSIYSTGTDSSVIQVRRVTNLDFDTSFCRLNTDNDTALLKYTGEHYITYTDPEVLAVLASPPYFADLDNDNLSGSYMDSETSYTSTTGGGTGSATSHTINVGAYVSFQHDFTAPITGTKLGSIETEASFTRGWTWETAESSIVEQSISYATTAGSDAVAFYSIPMETYVYQSLVPIIDENGIVIGYDEQSMSVNIPHTAAVKVLPLETYERIAADYSELPQISGAILKHTVGDPATYPSSTYGYKNPVQYDGDWSGVNYGNGSITQEISMTEEDQTSFTSTNKVEAKIGGGPGNWVFGVTAGYEHGSNQVTITTEGSSFAGTICNMPIEAEAYNYYYAWKIFSYEYTDGNKSFPIVNYLVTDVTAPPKLPKDFQQDTVETTAEQIALNWSYSGAAAGFQIYRYYEFPDGNGSYELAFVPASDAVGADINTGTRYYKYVDTGLDVYADYDYQIQVIGATPPTESILSPVSTFRTKTDVGYPDISLQGPANGKLLVYPDTNRTVNVIINNMGDYTQTPRYQWQKLTENGWTNLTGAIGDSYTFRSAGLADEGQYRCRVNAIYQNYYISDYSEVFTLDYSKRTAIAVDGSFSVRDYVNAADEIVPKIDISLKSAHNNHSYVPSGNVVFEVTGSDYKQLFPVELKPSILSGVANASLTLSKPLPDGAYEVTAYYTGSRVYKSLTTENGLPYLSGSGSGHVLTLDSNYTYGEDIEPVLKELSKDEEGITIASPIDDEVSYEVVRYSWEIERVWVNWGFIGFWWIDKIQTAETMNGFLIDGSVTAAEAGSYTLYASVGGSRVASREFTVDKRDITIGIQDQDGVAGDSLTHPDSSILYLHRGELAYTETISNLGLDVIATNSAGTMVTIGSDTDPGSYTIVGAAGDASDTTFGNYNISFLAGTYILTGPKYSITGISKLLNNTPVGTIALVTPEGNDNETWTTQYSNGTGLVFLASPFNGYDVKSWSVVKASNGDLIKTTGSSFILNHSMLSEDIIVTVEYQVTQSTLEFKAMNGIGGTVECTNSTVVQSGDVARNGAGFAFKATPQEGYHFVEWQLNEIGRSPSTPIGTPEADGSNTCEITMGNGNTVLYAVFSRNSYELTLQGDLQASYWDEPELSGGDPQLVIASSGDLIKGDKEVTVAPKPGFSVGSEAVWTLDGEPVTEGVSLGNQSYTFTMLTDTIVSVETEVEHYDVSLELTGPGSTENEVLVSLNGVQANPDELSDIAGGSTLRFTPLPAYRYVFDEWIVNGESSSGAVLNIAALSENLTVEAVFKDNNAYTITVDHGLRGSLSYTLNGGNPTVVAAGGVIPVFEGDTVVITAIPEINFMVENWVIDGGVVQTYIKTQTFNDISANISAEVVFGAQSYSTVTYTVADGGGGGIAATSDGVGFESGNNSIGKGSMLEFIASPDSGKMVEMWSLNGEEVKNAFGQTHVDTTFIIPALASDAAVEVSFKEILTHSVEIVSTNATTHVQYLPDFGTNPRDGAAAVFTVTPDPSYAVDTVTITGETVNSFDSVTENEGIWTCIVNSISEDIAISAGALPLYTIAVSTTGGGIVTGDGDYMENTSVTLTAMAYGGYSFLNWTENGDIVSTDADYTFPATNRNLVANFSVVQSPAPPPPPPPAPSDNLGDSLGRFLEDNYLGIKNGSGINGTINQGQVSDPNYFNSQGGNLVFGLNWGGSTLKLTIYSPDGKLYAEVSGSKPPLVVEVLSSARGEWSYTVTGIDVPHDGYKYTTMVGVIDVQTDPLRIDGADRYLTAVEVSKVGWTGAGTVLLARGDEFPDSLAGISLAYQLDAPILLTASNTLNTDALNEIKRLGAKRVIILGGLDAISADVEAALRSMVSTVDRLGGTDRYETAKLIAEELAKNGSFDTAFIATGRDFPDALAAASYAARQGVPILLTNTASVPTGTRDAISELGIKKTIVVGGPSVISNDVLTKLPIPTRIYGSTRYETALALGEMYLPSGVNQIYIATGRSFPDALAGSVLAAKRGSGVLLLPGNKAQLPENISDFITDRGIPGATIFGGSGAVSNGIRADLEALLK